MNNNINNDYIDNLTRLFFKVFNNKVLFNHIFKMMSREDIEFDNIDRYTTSHRMKFKNINSLFYIVTNNQWTILKEKLKSNSEIIITDKSIESLIKLTGNKEQQTNSSGSDDGGGGSNTIEIIKEITILLFEKKFKEINTIGRIDSISYSIKYDNQFVLDLLVNKYNAPISLSNLKYAIKVCTNIEMMKFILDSTMKCQFFKIWGGTSFYIPFRRSILSLALENPNLYNEIFKLFLIDNPEKLEYDCNGLLILDKLIPISKFEKLKSIQVKKKLLEFNGIIVIDERPSNISQYSYIIPYDVSIGELLFAIDYTFKLILKKDSSPLEPIQSILQSNYTYEKEKKKKLIEIIINEKCNPVSRYLIQIYYWYFKNYNDEIFSNNSNFKINWSDDLHVGILILSVFESLDLYGLQFIIDGLKMERIKNVDDITSVNQQIKINLNGRKLSTNILKLDLTILQSNCNDQDKVVNFFNLLFSNLDIIIQDNNIEWINQFHFSILKYCNLSTLDLISLNFGFNCKIFKESYVSLGNDFESSLSFSNFKWFIENVILVSDKHLLRPIRYGKSIEQIDYILKLDLQDFTFYNFSIDFPSIELVDHLINYRKKYNINYQLFKIKFTKPIQSNDIGNLEYIESKGVKIQYDSSIVSNEKQDSFSLLNYFHKSNYKNISSTEFIPLIGWFSRKFPCIYNDITNGTVRIDFNKYEFESSILLFHSILKLNLPIVKLILSTGFKFNVKYFKNNTLFHGTYNSQMDGLDWKTFKLKSEIPFSYILELIQYLLEKRSNDQELCEIADLLFSNLYKRSLHTINKSLDDLIKLENLYIHHGIKLDKNLNHPSSNFFFTFYYLNVKSPKLSKYILSKKHLFSTRKIYNETQFHIDLFKYERNQSEFDKSYIPPPIYNYINDQNFSFNFIYKNSFEKILLKLISLLTIQYNLDYNNNELDKINLLIGQDLNYLKNICNFELLEYLLDGDFNQQQQYLSIETFSNFKLKLFKLINDEL